MNALARIAANRVPETRWYDPDSDATQFDVPVGVMDLLGAGADVADTDAVALPSHVEVMPYRGPGGGWLGKVTMTRLRVLTDGDAVRMLSTRESARSDVFDSREAAVAFCERHCETFARAEERDARGVEAQR